MLWPHSAYLSRFPIFFNFVRLTFDAITGNKINSKINCCHFSFRSFRPPGPFCSTRAFRSLVSICNFQNIKCYLLMSKPHGAGHFRIFFIESSAIHGTGGERSAFRIYTLNLCFGTINGSTRQWWIGQSTFWLLSASQRNMADSMFFCDRFLVFHFSLAFSGRLYSPRT